MSGEWAQLQAADIAVSTEGCDTSEVSHVRRVRSLGPLAGVWHAAGVLADAVLPRQSAASLRACTRRRRTAHARCLRTRDAT